MKKLSSFVLAVLLFVSTLLFVTPNAIAANGSWQSYVDDELVSTGRVSQAAIVGLDGTLWAASPGFSPSNSELKTVVDLYKSPADAFASGIRLAGTKYLAIKADEESIYGKKGANGVVTVKTNQAVLIGIYDNSQSPGNAATTVEKLGDYLRDSGY